MRFIALLAVILVAMICAVSASARPMPGPKTYGASKVSTPSQWVKGFKAPKPSYLDRLK